MTNQGAGTEVIMQAFAEAIDGASRRNMERADVMLGLCDQASRRTTELLERSGREAVEWQRLTADAWRELSSGQRAGTTGLDDGIAELHQRGFDLAADWCAQGTAACMDVGAAAQRLTKLNLDASNAWMRFQWSLIGSVLPSSRMATPVDWWMTSASADTSDAAEARGSKTAAADDDLRAEAAGSAAVESPAASS